MMENYIYQDVAMMIDDGDYLDAFELISYLFLKIGDVDIDDSDGGVGVFADLCFETWDRILNEVNGKIEKKMYNWFIGHLDGSVIDYMEEYIEKILMQRFKSTEYLKDKLKYTENKVNSFKEQPESWFVEYNIEKWTLYHIEIMEELKYSSDDIYKYCRENWRHSRIREYYISFCISQKQYQLAIELLNESLQLDVDKPGVIIELE